MAETAAVVQAQGTDPGDVGPVGVVGAGVMGVSLVHALLAAGLDVVLHDRDPGALDAAPGRVRSARRVARLSRGRAGAEQEGALRVVGDLAELAGCGLVVENVTEDEQVKEQVHRDLDRVLDGRTVVAVNTSAVPITPLAVLGAHPDRVLGAHFMNPVATSQMVEVVRTAHTSDRALGVLTGVLDRLGIAMTVVEDVPGFVINRCLMMFVNEAAALLDDGVATPAQVDRLFRGCLGHRTGPLRTADVIGIDTIVDTLHVLAAHHGPERFTPSRRLVAMLEAGELGRKSGKGFYHYEEDWT
ncbi:3-hydroxyacyl-CoA dehydrogenase family protein [Cellulomonas phragmiteti]|uniref:3-hydroxybutyryl-CoA dehydrogenase n=1 Tax=Cellulomonas phragmiteti TaxID=478780 RepID=A0ABQ4DS38_9CELL|nr:3-hydroxyacyl-CoA dehydrogenase family protein [Cellulomonas phragmiteti]GIG41812.1 3-hydroxybutyryl-CoA dehydrogenase [Cellulomonas phragmiteti]